MPPVGNDIVDLRDPENLGKSRDGRFLERVFTAGEREGIAAAARPDALLWALWAAKEAAYKSVSRDDPSIVSIPRCYPVALEGGIAGGTSDGAAGLLTGRVATPRGELALRIAMTGEYVHALAAETEAAFAGIVHRVGWVDCPDRDGGASAFVRALVIREIAVRLNCPAADLAVSPPGAGVPEVFLRGRPLAAEISLSHDGRYAAFALRFF